MIKIKRDSKGRRTDRVKKREADEMRHLQKEGLTDPEIALKLKRKNQTVKRHLKKEATIRGSLTELAENWRNHQQQMLSLVHRWMKEVELKLVGCPTDGLTKTGIHWTNGIELLTQPVVWEVRDSNNVLLRYYFELTEDPQTMVDRGYLFEHLRASLSCSCLLQKMEEWKTVGGNELILRNRLLKRIEDRVRSEGFQGEQLPEPTTDYFSFSIWRFVTDGLHGNLGYRLNNSMPDLFGCQYGHYALAMTKSREEAERCEALHRELMESFPRDDLALKITTSKKRRKELTHTIQVELSKLVSTGIPGRCSGCQR